MTELNCPHCRRERELAADDEPPTPAPEQLPAPFRTAPGMSHKFINPMHVVDVVPTDPEIL